MTRQNEGKRQRKIVRLRKYFCDALIIGGGSAGLRAAIEAHDYGADVLIVSKSKKGDPHTVLATGGINAALGSMDPEDNWKIHAADTLREGKFLADHENVMTMCRNAPRAIEELVKWGARFQKEPDGRLTQRFFGAHSYRRTCFHADETGKEIVHVLMNQVHKRKIKIIDSIFITKIFDLGNEIKCAIGIDFKGKRNVIFVARCIILAGGGYARAYALNSSRPFENYGEGVALAYEAGADLIDMEMVQFHPTGMIWPTKAVGTLATESIRGEGGILLNAKGERFMKKYIPEHWELGPRDEVARAIHNEIISGRGTRHGGVWLDITRLSKKKILTRLPKMYKQFKELEGIDISKQKMEVAPTSHYSMGGVNVDDKGRTKIKGLFAIGEVTGRLHGANRLGGNSLLETIVFGRIVGNEAAIYSRHKKKQFAAPTSLDVDAVLVVEKDSKTDAKYRFILAEANKIRIEIQKLMQENAGVIRESSKLLNVLERIVELKKMFYEKEVSSRSRRKSVVVPSSEKISKKMVTILEIKSTLLISEAIIRSALMRQESRGAHYRSDFPKQNDRKWLANIYCTKSKTGAMRLSAKKVKETKGLPKYLLKSKEVQHHLLE